MVHMLFKLAKGVVITLIIATFLSGVFACSKNGNASHNENEEPTVAEEAGEGSKSDDGEENGEEKPGVPVEVANVQLGDISSYILLSSTIETESSVDVFPQTIGLVDDLLVEEGDHVRKGSILARLEDEEYALDEAKAEVAFRKLENDFKRIEKMYHDELISVEEYENARFELRQAELEWQKAKLLLKYTRIDAPIGGVVSERLINVGDRIASSTKIFSIVNLDSLIAVVRIPEREIDQVRLNQDVMVSSDFIRGIGIEGWVKRISPVVDPNSGTFKVTVGLKADSVRLKPGMFVNVHIVTGTHENTILVPRDAIVYDGGREYIYLASEESTATRVELDKGFSNNQIVEVLSGLSNEDHVIVVGQSGIKDGAKIKILEERADKEGEETS
jgi:membrane fusion protein (multidrug efflux system)